MKYTYKIVYNLINLHYILIILLVVVLVIVVIVVIIIIIGDIIIGHKYEEKESR